MSKESNFSFLKQKITLSYLILIVIAFVAMGILYNGIQNILHVDKNVSLPNQKLYVTNEILALIYDAEADARSFYLFRRKEDLDNYVRKLEDIKKRIDKCFILCKNSPQQVNSLKKIRELSLDQQEVIHKLIAIDNQNEQDLNYKRAFDEVYIQAYEIIPPTKIIKQNTVVHRDSVYKIPEKSNFFGRIKNLFSGSTNDTKEPKSNEVTVTTYDTIVQPHPLPDSLLKMMKTSLEKLKMRDNYLKSKEISTETQLLHSDRVILDKIREIVTSLETEEINLSTESISKSKLIINNTVSSVIWLAGISFMLVLLFVVLIFRDIAKNAKYNLALKTAQKNSEELVRVKEQFLAMMSHEIRTPLSSIIGFSEQLDKTPLTEKQELYLNRIRTSSDFLLNLVNDILDLSKINAGKINLAKIRFNLFDVIKDVYQNFILTAQSKNIEYTLECDPKLEKDVYGDPLRLRQVLINIVSNAIKFTEKGFVKVSAIVFEDEKNQIKVRIVVTDSGIGIPLDKQSMIFEEFSQADGSVTRKFGGTGLGLAIAQKIALISGGNISVSSEPEKGSTFTIILNFTKAVKSDEKVIGDNHNLGAGSIYGKKIMIVDDDTTLLLLVSSMLDNIEIKAETALNGQEALSKLKNHKFDLIFTDLNMPEMNGLELMKKIKSIDANVPIIAITANTVIDVKYQNSGFADFLSKPFKEQDFYRKIQNVLFPHFQNGVGEVPDKKNEDTVDLGKPYSIDEIIEFVGNEPEAIRKIVKSFVHNSLITLDEIRDKLKSSDFEEISGRAHKLIPLFKQFHLFEIVSNLEKLERYEELKLEDVDFINITQKVIEDSEKAIRVIETDWLPISTTHQR